LFVFHVSRQKVEETRPLEHRPHPGTGACNPQPAVRGCRQVERPDQLAHSGGIDSSDFRQIEHDQPFTHPKQLADVVAHRSIDRDTKRAFHGNDAGTLAMHLENYAQIRPLPALRLHRVSTAGPSPAILLTSRSTASEIDKTMDVAGESLPAK
jgi:hypothetical protein